MEQVFISIISVSIVKMTIYGKQQFSRVPGYSESSGISLVFFL